MSGKGASKSRVTISKSQKAGLIFPVSRIHRKLKSTNEYRVGVGAAVYLAAVLEYLISDLCEITGIQAKD